MGRNGYNRRGFQDRSGGTGGETNDASTVSRGPYAGDAPVKSNGAEVSGGNIVSGLDKRISAVQQEFSQSIHKISEKENEKFDLIFAILSELQHRQAQLEESVRSLKAQYGGGPMVNNGSQSIGSHQQSQFGSNGTQQYGQLNGQMNGQLNGQMNAQMGGQMNVNMGGQQIQQFTGVMNPDGTTTFTPVQQVLVVSSPTAAGMQYAVPQMMSPNGTVQAMPAQMMQFMPQGSGQEVGAAFMNGGQATPSQADGVNVQGNSANSMASSGTGNMHSSMANAAGPSGGAMSANNGNTPPASSTSVAVSMNSSSSENQAMSGGNSQSVGNAVAATTSPSSPGSSSTNNLPVESSGGQTLPTKE